MQTTGFVPEKAGAQQPWYKHRWPWLLMLGPAIVVVAGTYTAYLAASQPDALVVDDYYKQGKAINHDLRRDHAAAAMNLKAILRYDPANGKLIGTITSHQQPFPGMLHVSLVHSTQPLKDLKLDVQSDERGQFAADLPLLDMARWGVLVEGAQRDWRLSGEWKWPQQQQIELQANSVAKK